MTPNPDKPEVLPWMEETAYCATRLLCRRSKDLRDLTWTMIKATILEALSLSAPKQEPVYTGPNIMAGIIRAKQEPSVKCETLHDAQSKPEQLQPVKTGRSEQLQPDKPEVLPCQTPDADLRRGALQHYERLSMKCCDWYNVIPRAINFYFDHKDDAAHAPKQEPEQETIYMNDGHEFNRVMMLSVGETLTKQNISDIETLVDKARDLRKCDGSYLCPICGKETPHQHNGKEVWEYWHPKQEPSVPVSVLKRMKRYDFDDENNEGLQYLSAMEMDELIHAAEKEQP